MSDLQCSMLCPTDVEESLLDQLLIAFPGAVFSSTPTFGHGVAHGAMSAGEQVMGRARVSLVQIILSHSQWDSFRERLTREFAQTGIRFWTTSVANVGVLA